MVHILDINVVLVVKVDKQQKLNLKKLILLNYHVDKHYSMLLKCNIYDYIV